LFAPLVADLAGLFQSRAILFGQSRIGAVLSELADQLRELSDLGSQRALSRVLPLCHRGGLLFLVVLCGLGLLVVLVGLGLVLVLCGLGLVLVLLRSLSLLVLFGSEELVAHLLERVDAHHTQTVLVLRKEGAIVRRNQVGHHLPHVIVV